VPRYASAYLRLDVVKHIGTLRAVVPSLYSVFKGQCFTCYGVGCVGLSLR